MTVDDDSYIEVTHISDAGSIESMDADIDSRGDYLQNIAFMTDSFSEYVISMIRATSNSTVNILDYAKSNDAVTVSFKVTDRDNNLNTENSSGVYELEKEKI